MNIFGQLVNAQLENKAANYGAAGVSGRIWFNTATLKVVLDDGTLLRALLRNDGQAVFGNSGTAGNNIRFHRGANQVLQFVSGADTTAEGTLSAALNQISAKQENYLNAGKPAPGNAGRIIFVTDFSGGTLFIDNGTSWSALSGSLGIQPWVNTTTYSIGDLVNATGVIYFSLTNANLNNPITDPANWAPLSGSVKSKTANYTIISTDGLIKADATAGTFNLTLPAANVNLGMEVKIKKIDGSENAVTLLPTGGDLIDGEVSQLLQGSMAGVTLKCDGVSNWYVF